MQLTFYKYQGAGNDFIICDDRKGVIQSALDRGKIARLCDRRFGIGADGLMLLRPAALPYDFEMDYYNSDGNRSSMCGNGGRCIVRFANDLGISKKVYCFLAADGPHEATILDDGDVSLGMANVTLLTRCGEDLMLDTGSPHYVKFIPDLGAIDVQFQGRAIRQSPQFAAQGINVNFVQEVGEMLTIGTYERGVEDETLACGTGVTAAAIAHHHRQMGVEGSFAVSVKAKGGDLSVRGNYRDGTYSDLRLIGPAVRIFSGTIAI